jgi:glycosyltransferase involved in cell wall biosynthesis
MTTPSISVVIPAYNAEQTICAALDSVYEQAVLPAEIHVVDDVSTDRTTRIVREYITRHARNTPVVPTLHQQPTNGGPAAARNAGIAASRSDWIAFLDGDDMWLPHRLEVQLAIAAEHPDAALICSPTLPLKEDMAASQECSESSTHAREVQPRATPLPLTAFIYANPVATSTVLIKRSALTEAGGFDEQFRGPEDYDLWLRIVAKHTVIKTEEPLSLYRHVPGSLSMDDRTFLPQIIAVLEKAFDSGGALFPYANRQKRSYAEKFSSASWMAFSRGARTTALRHLCRSYATYPRRIFPEERDPLLRIKLLLRYLGLYSGSRDTP